MKEVVHREDEQQDATGRLKVADRHTEDVQHGISDEHEAETDHASGHRCIHHDGPSLAFGDAGRRAEIDRQQPDDVDRDEEWEECDEELMECREHGRWQREKDHARPRSSGGEDQALTQRPGVPLARGCGFRRARHA